jgi:hypothetical protein
VHPAADNGALASLMTRRQMSGGNGMAAVDLLGLPTKQFRKEETATPGFTEKEHGSLYSLLPWCMNHKILAKMERKGSCALEEKDPNLVI